LGTADSVIQPPAKPLLVASNPGENRDAISLVEINCKLPGSALDNPMFAYSAHQKDKSWQPGPYPGVELLVLHKNEKTGGVTVLRKFAAGVTVPAHIHPQANESVYLLSGEWEESGVTYSAGAFFFAPRGERHGPHVAKTEVISLTLFDGPLTVES
jgi:quercetin dioxygenase-like cupin family protein